MDTLISSSWRGRLSRVGLFVLIVLLSVTLTYLNYTDERKAFTKLTISQRQATVHLGAATLKERFSNVSNVGVSIASRPLPRDAIVRGDWKGALDQYGQTTSAFPFIDQVFLADIDGNLMAITGPDQSKVGKNYAYRDWYKGVSSEWKPYISEVYQRANEPKRNVTTVAIPIKTDRGAVLGILAFQTRIEELFDWVQGVKTEPAEFIYVVDKNGHLAYHPKYPPQDKIIDFSSAPAVQKVLRGEEGVEDLYNPIDKQYRLTAYAPVEPHGWGIVVTQPVEAAYTARAERLRDIVYKGLVLTGLTTLLAYMFLRIITVLSRYRQKEQVMLESIGDGLVSIDRNYKITLWNKVASELTGWTAAEAIGRPFQEIVRLVLESNGEPNYGFIEEVIRTGKVSSMENHTHLIRKDGTKISVGDSAAPVFDQMGNIDGIIVVFRDVTEEMKIQQLKQEQKEFLDKIFSSVKIGVIVAEAPSGKFKFINPAAIEILGREADPNASPETYSEIYDVITKNGQPFPSEEIPLSITLKEAKPAQNDDIYVRKPDGSTVALRVRSEPIVDPSGKMTSAITVFEDITAQRQLENDKEEFFTIASHELRTPLTAIRGDASMILRYYKEQMKDPALKEMVKDIEHGSIRLIELVNDFLDSSRLEQGRVSFHIQEFDIVPILKDVIEDLGSVAEEKQLSLALETDSGVEVMVNADPDRLKQIVVNFVGNALKFTEHGGVRLVPYEKDGQVIIDIIDTGNGISPENQKLLFRKFEQGSRPAMTRDVTKGSGLGLYISKMLAQGMGGDVQLAESVEGKGSTFRVVLERSQAQANRVLNSTKTDESGENE